VAKPMISTGKSVLIGAWAAPLRITRQRTVRTK
jgi:hypothetical protein